ncbi:MAG: murein hydrolase activator EnvC [Hyphomonadaceae bacterium]
MYLGPAAAQTTRTAAQAERDRRAEAARAERLRADASATRNDIRALDARLIESSGRRREAEAAVLASQERLAALQLQMSADDQRRRQSRDALESALIAAAFSARRIEPRAARAGVVARALAPSIAGEERRSSRALAAGRNVAAEIAEEQLVLAEASAAIDAERAEIVTLLERRRAAQTQLASDAAAAERRVRQLAAEARSLRELAQRVSRQQTRRGSAGPSVIPAAWLAPATGRVVRGFGVRTGDTPPTQGVTLRTGSGAQVVSPAAGEVAYAGVFRSYGEVLILNLDGGYALVLTGMDSTNVRVGERVNAGQPIGEMSAAVTPAPDLYVEVRRNGQVVDPGRWLNARGLTAEGSVRAG